MFLVSVPGQIAETLEGLWGGAGVADVFVEGDWVVWVYVVAACTVCQWELIMRRRLPAEPRQRLSKKKTYSLPVAPLAYSCWPLESIGSRFHSSQKLSIG